MNKMASKSSLKTNPIPIINRREPQNENKHSGQADTVDASKCAFLECTETLGRASPEIWPELIPGVNRFAAVTSPSFEMPSPPEWLQEFDEKDVNLIYSLGSLTIPGVLQKVKDLSNLAYQLGIEESREVSRGKFLHIIDTNLTKL